MTMLTSKAVANHMWMTARTKVVSHDNGYWSRSSVCHSWTHFISRIVFNYRWCTRIWQSLLQLIMNLCIFAVCPTDQMGHNQSSSSYRYSVRICWVCPRFLHRNLCNSITVSRTPSLLIEYAESHRLPLRDKNVVKITWLNIKEPVRSLSSARWIRHPS